jgi:hypothetical protein
MLSDVYLRGIMNHLGDKMLADAPEGYLDYPLPRLFSNSIAMIVLYTK